MYGHIERMAEEMKKGALAIEGVEVSLFQVNSAPSSRSNLIMFQVFKLKSITEWKLPTNMVDRCDNMWRRRYRKRF